MNSTYAQKSSTVQKAADTKAASVLDSSAQNESLQRKADMANNATQRVEAPRPNNTGMPDNLKSGIESLSGFSMDDVRVHYNSSKPATVQALAYTQGTDIHVAPGQEKCLPHEAWHVAQQMAGRVSPTTNINGMPVNDNAALEHEADVMGEKAVQCRKEGGDSLKNANAVSNLIQCAGHIELAGPVDEVGAKYGKAQTDPLKKGDGSASLYKDALPHIAFETMAGGDRVNELKSVYENVIKKYNGAASVCMGVNACADYYYQEGDYFWVLNDAEKETVPDLDDFDVMAYHSLTIIPFTWHLVGLKTEKNIFYTDKKGAEQLKQGKKPESTAIGKNQIKGEKYSFNKCKVEKGYAFPFFEARALLMNYAAQSGADLYRWMDSDVKDDASIDKINESGYMAFVNESKENEIKELFDSFVTRQHYSDVGIMITAMRNALNNVVEETQEISRLKQSLDNLICKKNEIDEKINMVKTNKIEDQTLIGEIWGEIMTLKKNIMENVENGMNGVYANLKSDMCKDYVLKGGKRVFSGCYGWRDDAGLVEGFGVFLQKINSLEKELRLSYWKIYCENEGTKDRKVIGPFDFRNETGYIPEPIVYMNSLAHHGSDGAKGVEEEAGESALSKLSHSEKTRGDGKQDREADAAFEGLPTSFIPDFSVSKPAKASYFKDVLECYKILKKPRNQGEFISAFRSILTGVRQTAYKNWNFENTTKKGKFEKEKGRCVGEFLKNCKGLFPERFMNSITLEIIVPESQFPQQPQ